MHCVSRGGSYLVNSCSELQEDNQWKKESYHACWINLVLETRPQYRLTLSETNSVRRESYKQQQVAHFVVLRSPMQTLTLGRERGVLTEHQLPSYSTTQRATAVGTEEFVALRKGSPEAERREGNVKPIRENFRATGLMSPLRDAPHRVQKRE
ncbi:telethonin [Kryptolebias marmoratus]|uniref:Telethonin-like n=1 Tax=Kryptolebias marmoratus TaxID=37003 RepID=A0A3Q3BRB4_KRYMA|nr:telethonin [Kryptolebias marmoratus]